MEDDILRAERAKSGSPYLNTAQAAHFLGISVRSMQRMRGRGDGPTPRRHARMVLYHIDDLRSWSQTRSDEKAS
ncbi:helix-turn-helix domain-containing protein [soil metagenome]